MTKAIPAWAMRQAEPEDLSDAREAHARGALVIQWPARAALVGWARSQGWPTPWFGIHDAFIASLLENDQNFKLGLNESGISLQIPKRTFTISPETLSKFDALYEERSSFGQFTGWRWLVEELREIRRAVEAGVVIEVEGARPLRTWQGFYDWAHGRYYKLEEGYDLWIGNDSER
jgi:hypothetical protein